MIQAQLFTLIATLYLEPMLPRNHVARPVLGTIFMILAAAQALAEMYFQQ